MPETYFCVRWPDESRTHCYSPSSTIKDALALNHPYPLKEFVSVCRAALEHANARVAQKYGFGCGHALAQIKEIEQRSADFAADAKVTVESFDP